MRSVERSTRLMEALEARTLFSFEPSTFPDVLTDLETSTNPVVLIETTMGNIYWELLPGDAPNHVSNILEYINDGDFASTFFHRLVSGFVLQGGEFVWDDDDATLTEIDENPPVVNEFARSNLQRTIAMAKLGGDPDSGRNQFFFNLDDNGGTAPFGLDFQNGGFTVFARVPDAASWAVVQAIAALPTTDNFLALEPTGALGEVPVTLAYNDGDPISEAALVRIVNMSLIKEAGSTSYYTHRLAFPEGFRADDDVTQSIDLVNLAASAGTYQIFARYEGGKRDRLIATGSIAAGASASVVISDFDDAANTLLRESAPVGFDVRTTTSMGAQIVREDFGAITSETFFNVGQLTNAELRTWVMTDGLQGDGQFPFIVWENLSDQSASISVRFFMDGGTQVLRATTTEPYRRGGYSVAELADVPDGVFAVRITSDQNIVASMSQFEAVPGIVPPGDSSRGFLSGGVPGGFANEGMLAGAIRRPGETTYLTLFNSSDSTGAVVRVIAHLDDGSEFQLAPIIVIPAGEHYAFYDLSSNGTLPTDEFFSLRFNSPTVPVAVQYTTFADGDSFSTPFQAIGGDMSVFAHASFDPTNASAFEAISVLNPYSNASVLYDYGIRFRFSDGTTILAAGGRLDAGNRVTIHTGDLIPVTTKISSNTALFSVYAIEVFVTASDGVNSFDGLVVATLTSGNRATGQAFTTIGTPLQNVMPLTGPGIGG